ANLAPGAGLPGPVLPPAHWTGRRLTRLLRLSLLTLSCRATFFAQGFLTGAFLPQTIVRTLTNLGTLFPMMQSKAAPFGPLSSSPELLSNNPLRALIRAFGLVERVMQPYFARFGITGAQWGVLRNLYLAEQETQEGLRVTDLGERLLIRPPSVTGIVDRMQRAGLVARGNSATDQRARVVRLTPEGRQVIQQVLAVHGGQ